MIVFSVGLVEFASAQVGIFGPGYPRGGYGSPYPSRTPGRVIRQPQPKFDPVVHFSLGYGYPNLDANELAGFYNYYRGPVTQTGPITGAVDIQYSRTPVSG
jgi:hypothetical protein